MKIVDPCRMHGISDATFYNWRSKYGGMEVSDAKRLKDLEAENRRHKQMLADTMLENRAIKEVLAKRWLSLPLYREEGLSLRLKRRRKRSSHLRVVLTKPQRVNQHWSMDFVADSLYNGRRIRILTVVDDLSKQCPVLEVDHSLTGLRITRVLERVALTRGLPEVITVENGPEFVSKAMDAWAY